MSDLIEHIENAGDIKKERTRDNDKDHDDNKSDSENIIKLNAKRTGCIAKPKKLMDIIDNNRRKCFGLSPISEIANSLIDTNIGTPVRGTNYRRILKGKRSQSALSLNLKYDDDQSNNGSAAIEENEESKSAGKQNKNSSILKDSGRPFSRFSTISNFDSLNDDKDEASNRKRKSIDGIDIDDYEDEGVDSQQSLISNNFTLNGNDEPSGNTENIYTKVRNITTTATTASRRLLNFSPTENNKLNSSFDSDLTVFTDHDDDEQTTMSPSRYLRREQLQFSPTTFDNNHNLDEIDGCSVDSGFGQVTSSKFKFAEPKLSIGGKKQLTNYSNMGPSPRKFILNSNNSFNSSNKDSSPKQFKIFHSLSSGSMESIDDEWSDLIEMESIDEEQTFPSNLTSLISGHIKSIRLTPEMKQNYVQNNNISYNNNSNNRPTVRRCLSMNENIIKPNNLFRKGLFNNDDNNNSTDYINSPLSEYNRNLIIPKTPEILNKVQENFDFTPTNSSLGRYQNEKCFKRPEPPCFSPVQSKRYKADLNKTPQNYNYINPLQQSKSASIIEDKENNDFSMLICSQDSFTKQISEKPSRPILRKSMSMNDAEIMTALSRSSSEPELIGDFSKPFCLPLMNGKHRDLKSISSDTLAKLIRGEFENTVNSFKIIDCRYPYEYEGGHITGAHNLYTQEQILEELVNCKTENPVVQPDGPKRNILVFHCEFSSERGPKLSRFLRNHDRWRNSNSYPALHYPEIYLLHGGYKEFYENYSELCNPIAYRPMLEPSFGEQLRQFRAKSKSWNGDIKGSCAKHGLKKSRSRLLL